MLPKPKKVETSVWAEGLAIRGGEGLIVKMEGGGKWIPSSVDGSAQLF